MPVAILGAMPQFAHATGPDYYWSDGTGNWKNVANWTIGSGTGTPATTVPPAGSNVFITDSDNLSRTITYDGTVTPINLSTFTVDQTGTGGATNTLLLSDGTIMADTATIGTTGILTGDGTTDCSISLGNSGTINANQSGQALVISVPSITNSSTIESTNGGGLSINNSAVNNSGGNISVSGAGSTLVINSTVVSGGTLSSDGSTYIDLTGTGTELDGHSQGALTVSSGSNVLVDSSSPVTLAGTIMNNGTMSDSISVTTSTGTSTVNAPPMDLQIGDANTHSATLEGSGTLAMGEKGSMISGQTGAESLINDTGHTISNSGTGTISNLAGFTNNGTINVGSGSLTLQGIGSFTNGGTINIPASATLSLSGQVSQTGGTTTVNGKLISSQTYSQEDGDLTGGGTLEANLDQTGGTLNPGDDPALFTIDGSYVLNGSGSLNIEIGGYTPDTGFSVLDVNGTADLDGNLNLTLVNGFVPQVGDMFTILNSQGDGGTFTGTTSNNPDLSYTVNYGSNYAQVLITAVPEPATAGLIGVCAAVLLSRRRRAWRS